MNADFDIAILGAGLAGSALALALRGSGARTAVIETHDLAAPAKIPLRAIALSDVSKSILQNLGAWNEVRADAWPVRKIHVSEQGVFGVTRIRAAEEGLDALGQVVLASDLARALHRLLRASPQVSLLSPARATEIARHSDDVAVRVGGAGGVSQLRAKLLVLADGGASGFAERLGFRFRTTDYRQSAVVAAIDGGGEGDVAFERFTAHGPLAVLPAGGRRRVVAWVHARDDAAAVAALPDDQFTERLQRDLGWRLGKLHNPGPRFVYPLGLNRSLDMVRGRVALLGDAAHRVHPVAGQGFNLALRDVAFLSECVFDALGDPRAPHDSRAPHDPHDPRDPGAAAVLNAWRRQRMADVRRVVRFTDALARLFVMPGRPAACARGLGLAALDLLPPLRRGLVRRGLGLVPPWPRLAGERLADEHRADAQQADEQQANAHRANAQRLGAQRAGAQRPNEQQAKAQRADARLPEERVTDARLPGDCPV